MLTQLSEQNQKYAHWYLVRILETDWRIVSLKGLRKSGKAVHHAPHHCLIEQGLIWCVVQAKHPLLICQC